jgi:GTP pyrophosphokinase
MVMEQGGTPTQREPTGFDVLAADANVVPEGTSTPVSPSQAMTGKLMHRVAPPILKEMPEKIRLSDILDRAQKWASDADLQMIRGAYVYSAKMHDGQERASGEPYLMHPLTVAYIVADMHMDTASVCAALLHDCIEDTLATAEDITEHFGEEVTFLVDGVTKLSTVEYSKKEERQAETFRKMLVAMAEDLRVLIIKLADRVHNMRTLQFLDDRKRQYKARETLDIYGPLAGRLGIQWIKEELEDLAFKYLYPQEYDALRQMVAKTRRERERYISEVVKQIDDLLGEHSLKAEVKGRPKNLYSIYRKMERQNVAFERVYDAIAFRIFCDTVAECYAALGVVHSQWVPVPGRIKDYVALPKPNGYQSLHTTVVGPLKEPIEIQIRTHDMHRVAEHGVASHWRYKEQPLKAKDGKKFDWLRQLMETQAEVKDPNQFMESVRVNLFQDEVYVFTPAGDVLAFPVGATPIDFSYAIHTEVGHHCAGARVNGAMVQLRYQLQSGDHVEILTNPTQRPSKDWLEFAATSKAKTKIRGFLHAEERARSRELGQGLLERELRKRGLSYQKLQKKGELEKLAQASRYHSLEELVQQIGYGKLEAATVVREFFPKKDLEAPPPKDLRETSFERMVRKIKPRTADGIRLDGVDSLLVRFGRCCNPLPGDAIVGFITRGRGITVHRARCPRVAELDPERKVSVSWDSKQKLKPRPVTLRVVTAHRPGILAAISHQLSESNVNIASANCQAGDEDRAVNTFSFSVNDLEELKLIVKSIKRIGGVHSVDRV